MGATSTVESFELAGRSGFHLMQTPFLQEIDELRSMVEVYLKARAGGPGHPKTARVIAMCHIYVGENSAGSPRNRRAGVGGLSRGSR